MNTPNPSKSAPRPTIMSPAATVAATLTFANSPSKACNCTAASGKCAMAHCVSTLLRQNLDHADEVSASIKTTIDKYLAAQGIAAPVEAPYQPVWQPGPAQLQLDIAAAGIRSVVWSIGYRSDYSWIDFAIFDGKGYPRHERGVTPVSGLYFLGLPWQYTWGSGRFSGVAKDAAHLAGHIELKHHARQPRPNEVLYEWALGS